MHHLSFVTSRAKTAFAFALVSIVLSVPAIAQDTQNIATAEAAASTWLALVDAGDYVGSWQQSAPPFQAAVAQPQWESAIRAARPPLGAAQSRKVKSATPTQSLPGAPAGDYVVIEFDTQFEHKPGAVETVTPMRQPDGGWKVAGYFIR